MTPGRKAEIARLFHLDPGSVYEMSEEELDFLLMEFGEREHILDAIVMLNADQMSREALAYARGAALGIDPMELM
mgnify:CR=1 FL=1